MRGKLPFRECSLQLFESIRVDVVVEFDNIFRYIAKFLVMNRNASLMKFFLSGQIAAHLRI